LNKKNNFLQLIKIKRIAILSLVVYSHAFAVDMKVAYAEGLYLYEQPIQSAERVKHSALVGDILKVESCNKHQWCKVDNGYVKKFFLTKSLEPKPVKVVKKIDIKPMQKHVTVARKFDNKSKKELNKISKVVAEQILTSFNKSENKKYEVIPVSLNALVKQAVKRNSTLLSNQLQANIAQRKIKFEEGILDPILTFSLLKSKAHVQNDVSDQVLQSSTDYRDDIIKYSAGIRGMLSSGASWDFSYSEQAKESSYIKRMHPSNPKEYTNGLTLNLRQPIMKGLGEDNTFIKINIANVESMIVKNEYSKNSMDLIGTVIRLYWNFYGSYQLYASWEDTIKMETRQIETLAKGVKHGVKSDLEHKKTKKALSFRKLEQYKLKTQIFDIQSKLLNLLSFSSKYNEHLLLIPTDDVSIENITIPLLEESFKASILNWPELKILKEKQKLEKLKLDYAKEQQKPSVDLVFSLSNNNLDSYANGIRKNILKDDYVSFSIGLEVEMPFNNTYAKENYQIEKLKHIQITVELAQTERTLNNALHTKIVDLKNNKDEYREYLNGMRLQSKVISVEEKRFNLGKSSIISVINEQEVLLNYKKKMLNNIVNTKLSEASLQKAMGVLLENYGIELSFDDENLKLAEDGKYEIN